MQKQRQMKAAVVIQHFFIKIKAEIEMEIVRMRQMKAAKKKSRGGNDRSGRQNKLSARIENPSCDSISFNAKGSWNSTSLSVGQSRRVVQNGVQDFHLVRNASPSMERMSSIHAANSTGIEGSIAYQMNNGIPRNVAHHNAMSQASPSNERIISTSQMNDGQLKTQNAGHNLNSQYRNHAGWRTPSGQSSVQHVGQATWNESTSRHQMLSYQSFVGSSPSNQAFDQAKHAPSPSYGHSHSYHHPTFTHNSSLYHPPNLPVTRGAHIPQSEPNQRHNHPFSTPHHLTTNLIPHPISQHSRGVLNTGHHPQHKRNDSSHQIHHLEHLRHPEQSQPPTQNNDHYNMRQYQQNARYWKIVSTYMFTSH